VKQTPKIASKDVQQRISILQHNLGLEPRAPEPTAEEQATPSAVASLTLPLHVKNLSLFTLAEENSEEHSSNNNTKEDIEHIYTMKRKQLQVKDLFDDLAAP
jgi:hypothetical protein